MQRAAPSRSSPPTMTGGDELQRRCARRSKLQTRRGAHPGGAAYGRAARPVPHPRPTFPPTVIKTAADSGGQPLIWVKGEGSKGVSGEWGGGAGAVFCLVNWRHEVPRRGTSLTEQRRAQQLAGAQRRHLTRSLKQPGTAGPAFRRRPDAPGGPGVPGGRDHKQARRPHEAAEPGTRSENAAKRPAKARRDKRRECPDRSAGARPQRHALRGRAAAPPSAPLDPGGVDPDHRRHESGSPAAE